MIGSNMFQPPEYPPTIRSDEWWDKHLAKQWVQFYLLLAGFFLLLAYGFASGDITVTVQK